MTKNKLKNTPINEIIYHIGKVEFNIILYRWNTKIFAKHEFVENYDYLQLLKFTSKNNFITSNFVIEEIIKIWDKEDIIQQHLDAL